ncbi:MAG: Holliday junction resolvase RuvX [Elusimicrobia bacterium]|nr:Holliday junction resolvase RuvX [Elusimicrobiota bacterium]
MKRIMGLDVGEKTIGLAVTDPLNIMAQPVTTISRTSLGKDFALITETILTYDIGEIVIGLPLNMDGSSGEKVKVVLSFKDRLSAAVSVPVTTWDERLSTVAMQKTLIAAAVSRQKRKKVIDKLAAVFILQGYMDAKKMRRKNG